MKNRNVYLALFFVSFIPNIQAQTAPNWSWARSGQGIGNDTGESISTDPSGNCYVTGSYQGPTINFGTDTLTDPAAHNFFLTKYDSLGNMIWARKAANSIYSYGTCVSTDKWGNSYATGYSVGGVPITFGNITITNVNSSSEAAFIVKYDTHGNVLWAKSLGGIDAFGFDLAVNNAIDEQGNVFIVAAFESTNSPNFLIKLDSAGNLIWQKSLVGPTYMFDAPDLCTDAVGNCYVTGIFGVSTSSITFGTNTLNGIGGDIFVVKYDPAGNVIWAKNDGDGGLLFSRPSISTDNSQNVYVSGTLYSTEATFGTVFMDNTLGNSTYDAWLVKYNSLGQLSWAKQIGNPSFDELIYCHKTDSLGFTYLAGQFSYQTTFGNVNLSSSNNVDIFVAKYAPSGTAIWAQKASGNGSDFGKGIALSGPNSIYACGVFGSPDCVFSASTLTNFDAFNNHDVFIAKIQNPISSTIGFAENLETSNVVTFPNPFSSSATISTVEMKDASLTITNFLGEVVMQEDSLSGNSVTILRENLSSGIYFIQLSENGNVIGKGKLIVVN
jgi:Secretion system C-terminal sorting domain